MSVSATIKKYGISKAVNYLYKDPEKNLVLLSGGDTLMLPNAILRRYLAER